MRSFLYHETYPNGKIFTDKDEFDDARRSGWVEAKEDIGKPKRRPGRPRVRAYDDSADGKTGN